MNMAATSGLAAGKVLRSYGVHGWPAIMAFLPYVSYNNLMTVPTYHMLLHGVLKALWSIMLVTSNKVLTARDKAAMTRRAAGLVLTNDFDNSYSDIVGNWKTWKIYDWMTWADVWYAFIMDGITLRGTVHKVTGQP